MSEGDEVAWFVRLCVCWQHCFVQPQSVLTDELMSGLDDPAATPKVLLQPHLIDLAVPLTELQNVAHITSPPLIDGLVVVTDDTDVCSHLCEHADQRLLDWVYILVLVDDDVLDPLSKPGWESERRLR